jgi:solute carrier family 25 protein 16
MDKTSLQYIIKTGLAGGIAGSSAKTLVAPLDRIKILFQTGNPQYRQFSGSMGGLFRAAAAIYRTDGGIGFFQGHSATLLRVFPYAAIKFVAYEQVRRVLIPSHEHETAIRRLLSGSIAGLCSVFITYPLDLIRVRLAFETKKVPTQYMHIHHKDHYHDLKKGRLTRVVGEIYKEHPIVDRHFFLINWIKRTLPSSLSQMTNFYRGFIPTIMGMVPYAGVSFLAHDTIHDIMRSPLIREYTVDYTRGPQTTISGKQRIPLNTWAQLLAGGLAGMVSQTASYPFEVVRRRMQVGGVDNGQFVSMKDVAKKVWIERGFKGFYVGLSIGFVKIVPMVACSFYVYERCKFNMGI